MHFADSLIAAIRRVGNPILVGIDPRAEELPPGYLDGYSDDLPGVAKAIGDFGRTIVDIVAPLVPAVKFQSAFFEAYGPWGVSALHSVMEHARQKGLIIVFDGKRNDIGSTAEAYARAYLGKVPAGGSFVPSWTSDSLTVNPYLGSDGINPFVKIASKEGKGLFVLVRTSNPSAGEFQDLTFNGKALYQLVADKVVEWGKPHLGESGYSLVGAVVGATAPQQLAEMRAAMPGTLLLVPGYGHQGGTAKDVAHAFDDQGLGAVVNNSRGITFAYARPDAKAKFGSRWEAAVEQAVRDMSDDLAAHSTTSRLK